MAEPDLMEKVCLASGVLKNNITIETTEIDIPHYLKFSRLINQHAALSATAYSLVQGDLSPQIFGITLWSCKLSMCSLCHSIVLPNVVVL
jgi:hypothetical protein